VTTSDVSELVRGIAKASDLPLAEDRVTAVTQILEVWLKAANQLSLKMSAPEFANLGPITGILQTTSFGEVSNAE
jgi:hypothetical protein